MVSTPSVATIRNSQLGSILNCSIWGTGDITCFHGGLSISDLSRKSPKLLQFTFRFKTLRILNPNDDDLVGMRTPPTRFSLMAPPMAVTRSRSLGLEVLWSWVSCRASPPTLATARPSPRLATTMSPCLTMTQVAEITWRHRVLNFETETASRE